MTERAVDAAALPRAAAPSGAAATRTRIRRQRRSFLFWALMVSLLMEFLRPEPLVQLRLQMLFVLAVPALWLASSHRPWSRTLTLQVAFLIVCAAMVPFARNNYWALQATRAVAGYVVIGLAITWLLANRRDFVFAIWFFVGMMAFQAFHGVMYGGRGYGALLGDENDLAVGLNIAIPFVFAGSTSLRGGKRWLCMAILALLVSGTVASQSRGGFVGMAATILYCVLMGRHRIRNLAILAAGSLIFLVSIPESYKSEVQSIQDTSDGTAEQRLFLWLGAINMWKDHPILGVGPGNYPWNIGIYQPEGRASGLFSGREYHERDFTMKAAHSVLFQVFSETGLVGTGLFLAIVVGHYRMIFGLRRRVERARGVPRRLRADTDLYVLGLGGAMTSYLAAGAFVSVAYYPYLWYVTALGVAFSRAFGAQLARFRGARPTGPAGASAAPPPPTPSGNLLR